MDNVRAVERALELLECFSDDRKNIGLSELSRMLLLPKATVLRLARTLENKGYLIQDADRQHYRLGPKVLALGQVFLAELEYRQVALPFMEELRNRTQESVSLYAVSGDERVCVQRVESPHALRQVISIGARLPLNRGSAGKLLIVFQNLAGYEEDITWEERKHMLEKGYAHSFEEREQGLASLSVPIWNNKGQVIASLTLSGPSFRFTIANNQKYVEEALRTAKQISYQLGYLG
jgi:DNA-binding IclR family transcriptional regulator